MGYERGKAMIRILIERHVREGKEADLMSLLRELRTAAMHQPGYITGETLASTEDASIIAVLSTWRSLDDWKAWEASEPRNKLYQQIEPLLLEKPEVAVYQVMAMEEKIT